MRRASAEATEGMRLSGADPQGVQVTSFKTPGSEELAHDFLWRANRAVPARGHIGIFNRSHYEEVLVVRVHPEFLAAAQFAEGADGEAAVGRAPGGDRDVRTIHLTRQGTVVLKFFLNVSKHDQKRRFLETALRQGEALEVQRQRPDRAQLLGLIPARLPGGDRRHRDAPTPPGSWCPPTTSGSPG